MIFCWGKRLILIAQFLFQYDEICKIEGPLNPLWVKIKPSSKVILLIETEAFKETPARDLQKSKISLSKIKGTRAGSKLVTFKLNFYAIL